MYVIPHHCLWENKFSENCVLGRFSKRYNANGGELVNIIYDGENYII